jgi:hypothetical protein
MYSPQCHGPCLSASTVRNSSVMHSQFSSDRPSDASAEAATSRQRIVTSFDQPYTHRRPLSPRSQRPRTPASLPQSVVGSSRLKRRASQGSLFNKSSPVSRFLSRSTAASHPPFLDTTGSVSRSAEFRPQSLDSRLHISTASSSLAARSTQSTPSAEWNLTDKDDYPSVLPPTPPEDDDHIAWSPRNNMLAFESLNQGPGLMHMDEGPNMRSASGSGPSDTLGSPSDNISPSSSGGSPRSSSGDMDCDDNSWLENSIQTTGKYPVGSIPGFSQANMYTPQSHRCHFQMLEEKPPKSYTKCFPIRALPINPRAPKSTRASSVQSSKRCSTVYNTGSRLISMLLTQFRNNSVSPTYLTLHQARPTLSSPRTTTSNPLLSFPAPLLCPRTTISEGLYKPRHRTIRYRSSHRSAYISRY